MSATEARAWILRSVPPRHREDAEQAIADLTTHALNVAAKTDTIQAVGLRAEIERLTDERDQALIRAEAAEAELDAYRKTERKVS